MLNEHKFHIWHGFLPIFLFLIIQQAIVASSSIWLTHLILSISEGQPSLSWLWLYLISLIFPYFPGALAWIEATKSQIGNCLNYVQKFSELYPDRVLKWSNHDQRSTISSILSAEACPTIHGYVEYLYHLASSGINVLFNLSVLALLINSSLLITYGVGIGLASIILYFQKHLKAKLALKTQQSRIQWTVLLIKAWDNILLNNAYNLNIWNKRNSIEGKSLSDHTIELEKFNQFIGVLMAFALILPSMILITYLAVINIQNLTFLATLTVLFPRLFQILTYSYELLFHIADFPLQKAKLSTVLSVLDPAALQESYEELLGRIQWGKISLKHNYSKFEVKDLLLAIPNTGRITIHGENGSGKTSLLLLIKSKYKDKAFYLPAKQELLFDLDKNSLSTGQQTIHILKEIKHQVEAPIILLDEWDANLDKKNKEELSLLIDELALNHCVIEILHAKLDEPAHPLAALSPAF